MRTAEAFSPGHITGIFQICDEAEDLLLKGSRGAGASISRGVTTKVSVERSRENTFEIRINGEKTCSAKVSEYVLKSLLSIAEGSYRIQVEHSINIPVGSGIGSSGAGALSLALALNEALELGLTKVEAAQIAHIAEINCRTGLGTVAAEFYGGLKIGIVPGAPGISKAVQIPNADEYSVLFLHFGPISTREFLSNESMRRRVNEAGAKLLDELIDSPSPENFMVLSRRFAEELGIMSKRLKETLSILDDHGYIFSMAMLGETAFSLIKKNEVESVSKVLEKYSPSKEDVYIADIDFRGARVI